MERVRIGTRGSDLALWQARFVAGRLEAAGCRSEIVVLKTRGDRIDDVPLHRVLGKGFFTAEIEQALLEERIDLAVHSHKDLPFAPTSDLSIAAVPARGPAAERLLIAPHAHDEDELFFPLKRSACVGTSAPRRTAQLLALRPDLEPRDLRGNVPTRVARLREGRFDAIVLAAAGLERLGLDTSDLVEVALPVALFVPAPAQGALAVQVREHDEELRALCARVLDDPPTARAVAAERSLLAELGGGCNLPLGALVEASGESGARAWRAHCFLGAGHPSPGAGARWSAAFGDDPASAARAAGALLDRRPTLAGPLAGLVVALTGARESARELAQRLETLGARVSREIVLEIEDLEVADLAAKLAGLRAGDALALTSAHAARALAGLRVPEGVAVAAVGAATARALLEAGIGVDVTGEHGARELAGALRLAPGARVLFPCAEAALGHLESELGRRGIRVERVVLYRTRLRAGVELDPTAEVRIYLSPSAVRAAHQGTAPSVDPRARAPIRLALGQSTRAALDEAGFDAELCASTHAEDVVRAIARATRRHQEAGGAR